jgi:hypothetical protein
MRGCLVARKARASTASVLLPSSSAVREDDSALGRGRCLRQAQPVGDLLAPQPPSRQRLDPIRLLLASPALKHPGWRPLAARPPGSTCPILPPLGIRHVRNLRTSTRGSRLVRRAYSSVEQ